MEETKTTESTTVEVRDFDTLMKVGPKKMNNEELCFMVNKLKKDRDQFEQQMNAYKESAEKAFGIARESEAKLDGITRNLNTQYDFILRQIQLVRDSIYLSIKGEI